MTHLIVLVVAVLLFYITPIHCQGDLVWSTSTEGNGHEYKYFLLQGSSRTIYDAMDQCLGYGNSTFTSYLVAIDSKQESDFIKPYINWNLSIWIGSGPGTNQPLFNIEQTWDLNNAGVNDVAFEICELEPISEVYVPSIGTDGGSITINNNLSQFNISTINITFYNPPNNSRNHVT
ncbi:hypothetical protein DFA_08020 [Cavenderia fasciculata]|uniref:C-type lectin domain-containing protein n=1 Tax=Cavenderia fasciculata TaxID=261658 RepID=F4Q4N0_CACFS|nr:uncharacterized protein DFA_08020 [Cavenderia fasciculata]EGG17039.1 hypothetical protein DFA_08020 [Cavenderia fasciculata]|eukprot:XP_004355523.1 hypothetical protein DFA_08020 [Cavenderia fasciculata]